jgi:hypothetical protein
MNGIVIGSPPASLRPGDSKRARECAGVEAWAILAILEEK